MRFFLLVLVAIVGCGGNDGGDNSPAQDNTNYSLVVQDAAGLPACDESRKGALAYVKAESKFYACDGAWAAIDIKGEKGDVGAAGAAGAQGPKGDAGEAGTTNHIKSVTSCGGQLETTGIWYSYQLVDMVNGDVIASANIRNNYIQASQTRVYAFDQVGAINGSVILQHDLSGADNSGFWVLTYSRTAKTLTVVAEDLDLTGGKVAFAPPASDCSAHTAGS